MVVGVDVRGGRGEGGRELIQKSMTQSYTRMIHALGVNHSGFYIKQPKHFGKQQT
jgi:hypothetical protein